MKKEEVEFSKVVRNQAIKENNYSIQAGQYLDVKEKELDYDIDEKLNELKEELLEIINQNKILDNELKLIFEEEF